MKRNLKARITLALAITVFAAVCGMLAGYWIGREITLGLTAKALHHDATRAIAESDMYAHDAHGVLDAMNASRSPYCLNEDMEYLHNLLYQSIFLKEIGRIRDDRIVCSTTLGREHPSTTKLPKPDDIGTDGVKVYRNPVFFRLPNVAVTTLQAGDSYVVLYPYFDSLRERSAIHMKTTVIDTSQSQSAHAAEGDSKLTQPILTRDSDFRIGEVMYSTRCSSLSIDHICITASLSMSEALEVNHWNLKVFIVFGGLTGAFFGFFCSMLYRRNHSIEQQLRRAISRDKIEVFYQPIVHLASRRIVGAEALARWTNDEGTPIGPDVFIKIAEERGFVGTITKLVIRHALRDLGATLRNHPYFGLSINVAASDLSDPEFLPVLERSIKREAVPARSLAIEITERSTVRRDVAIETICRLRERGHRVHIDDFGTGYSSLAYLQDLSVDAIKIDRAFTQTIGTDAVTMAILPSILALASALNLGVIAEGVETDEQASYFAKRDDSILVQGWLFGRPAPAAEFRRLLDADVRKALVSEGISELSGGSKPLQVA
jgi:sensor c-di-GMP phosphodiesterase-like protein